MNTYTISEKTLRALVRKRAELCAEYGQQLAKPNGMQDAFEMFAQFAFNSGTGYRNRATCIKQALTNRQWANVRLVNGTVIDCALPVKRMAQWAKGAGKVSVSIMPGLRPILRGGFKGDEGPTIGVKLTHGMSSVTFYGKRDEAPLLLGYHNTAPVAWLGESIPLNAPAQGGEFLP